MGDRHAVTNRQRKRISKFETKILPKALKKKRFRQTLIELDRAFGDVLVALLTTRPQRATGVWTAPNDAQLSKARHLILGRVLKYARHDPGKVGDAKSVRTQIPALKRAVARTSGKLSALTQRTKSYIQRHDREIPTALSELHEALDKINDGLTLLEQEFPDDVNEVVKTTAKAMMEFIVLTYLEATGVYPSASGKTPLPSLVRSDTEAFVLIAEPPRDTADWKAFDDAPPLLHWAKSAVYAVEKGRAESRASKNLNSSRATKLSTNAFEAIIAKLREETDLTE